MDARVPLILVGLLLLAGGCLSAEEDPGTGDGRPGAGDAEEPADQRPSAKAPTFREPVEVTRHVSAEPAAITGPEGELEVLVWTRLFESTDGGASYEEVETPFSDRGDSDLVYLPDGSGHYVGAGIDDEGPKLPYHRAPEGDAWSNAQELAPNSTSVDRPWIAQLGNATLLVTWNDFEEKANRVRISRDGGATWGSVTTLGPPFGFLPGQPATSGETILQPRIRGGGLFVAISEDAGRTWVTLPGPDTEGQLMGLPSLAFDATGTAYLAAAVAPGEDGDQPRIQVWRSEDAGRTWSEPTVTTPEASTAIFPWIEAGRDGRVVVASYENIQGTNPNADDAVWYPRVTVSTLADQTDPRWNGTRIGETPIRIGPICTGGSGCESDDWQIRDYFEIDLTDEGRPFVAYAAEAVPGQAIGPGLPGSAGQTGSEVKVMATVATDGWQAHRR